MKKKIFIYSLLAILSLFIAVGCAEINKVTDAITHPSAREVYQREFKNSEPLYASWDSAYKTAISDSVQIEIPYGERGTFSSTQNFVYSYDFSIEEGKTLSIEISKDSVSQRVFIDLFELKDSIYQLVESNKMGESKFEFAPRNSGNYKLILQPEIYSSGNFFIAINERPSYGFPVAGKGNEAIQSFWG